MLALRQLARVDVQRAVVDAQRARLGGGELVERSDRARCRDRSPRIAERHGERIGAVDLDDRAEQAAADVGAVEAEAHRPATTSARPWPRPVSPPTGGEESSTSNRARRARTRRARRPRRSHNGPGSVNRISNQCAGSDRGRERRRARDPEPDGERACSARRASADRWQPSAVPFPARGRGEIRRGLPGHRRGRVSSVPGAAVQRAQMLSPGPMRTAWLDPEGEAVADDALGRSSRRPADPGPADVPSAREVRSRDRGSQRRVLIVGWCRCGR